MVGSYRQRLPSENSEAMWLSCQDKEGSRPGKGAGTTRGPRHDAVQWEEVARRPESVWPNTLGSFGLQGKAQMWGGDGLRSEQDHGRAGGISLL